MGAKHLHTKFAKVNGFIRIYDENKHLVFFSPEKYYPIFNRVRYLMRVKSGITYVISRYYANIKYGFFTFRKKVDIL